eukprot:m.287983 g.287983  ORF g.287983 m.287983 type:complete len:4380 (-) comp19448_c1_seq3:277-13416(-)
MATRKTPTARKSSPSLSGATRRPSGTKTGSSTATSKLTKGSRTASVPAGLKTKRTSTSGSPKTSVKSAGAKAKAAAADAWEKEKGELTAQLAALQEKLDTAEASRAEAEERLQALPELEQHIEEKAAQLAEAEAKALQAEETQRALEQKLDDAVGAATSAQSELQQLQGDSVRAAELEAEVAAAQQSASRALEQYTQAEALRTEAHERAEMLEKDLASLQEQGSGGAAEEVDELRRKVEELQAAKERADAALHEGAQAASDRIVELEQQLAADGVREQLQATEQRAAELEAKLQQDGTERLDALQEQCKQLEARNADLEAKLDAAAAGATEEVEAGIGAAAKAAHAAAEAAHERADKLERELKELRAAKGASVAAAAAGGEDAVSQALAEANAAREQAEARASELQARCDALEDLTAAASSTLVGDQQQRSTDTADAEVERLKRELEDLRASSSDGASSAMTAAAAAPSSLLGNLTAAAYPVTDELQAKLTAALEEADALKAEAAAKQAQIDELNDTVRRLQKKSQQRSFRRRSAAPAVATGDAEADDGSEPWQARVFFVGDTRARPKMSLVVEGNGRTTSVALPDELASGMNVSVQLGGIVEVDSLRLSVEQADGVGDWHLLHVELEDPTTGQTLTFPFENWSTQIIELLPTSADQATLDRDESLIALPREYLITTHTSDMESAGTTSNVAILLMGTEGDSEPILLSKPTRGGAPFTRGHVDTFAVTASSVGDIRNIRIGHDHLEDDWHLEQVVIRDVESDKVFTFPCGQWFGTQRDNGQTERVLSVYSEPVEIPYAVTIYTSDLDGAGTDANVAITVSGKGPNGEDNANEINFAGAPAGTFSKGKVDRFGIKVISIDAPTMLRIGHDGSGDLPDWHVDKVVLENKLTHMPYEFPVHRWIKAPYGKPAMVDLVVGEVSLDDAAAPATNKHQHQHRKHHQQSPQKRHQAAAAADSIVPADDAAGESVVDTSAVSLGLREDVEIEIQTGSDKVAGTDAAVYIVLVAADGEETEQIPLTKSLTHKKPFHKGQTDRFTVRTEMPTQLAAVRIGHDKSGVFSWWLLNSIKVTSAAGKVYLCPHYDWLPSEQDESLERVIPARDVASEIPYELWIETSNEADSGVDGVVQLTVKGQSDQGEFVEDCFQLHQAPKGAFSTGKLTKLEQGVLQVAEPEHIEVAVNTKGKKDKFKPAKLSMVNTTTGRAFVADINTVVLPDEPVEVGMDEANEYVLTVVTTDQKYAGTDASVTAVISGEQGETEPIVLKQSMTNKNPFERGQTDEFVYFGRNVEPVTNINIGHDGANALSTWMVDKVEVKCRPSGAVYMFPFYGSIPDDTDKSTQRSLVARDLEREVPYSIVIQTADEKGSSCDSTVTIDVSGFNEQREPVTDSLRLHEASKSDFSQGRRAEFSRGILDMHEVDTITVRHDGSGKHNKWILEQVELTNESSGVMARFLHRDLVAKDADGVYKCKLQAHPAIVYEVTTKTSNFSSAATSAGVEITLVGTRETTTTDLKNSSTNKTPFRKGQTDTFEFEAEPAEPLTAVIVSHDGKGVAFNWHLESVTVRIPKSGTEYNFPCADWLCDADGTSRREIPVRRKQDETPYRVAVYTGSDKGSDTDCGVRFDIAGQDETGAVVQDTLKFSPNEEFERGSLRTFKRGLVGVHVAENLTVSLGNKGKHATWFLDQVVLTNLITNEATVFRCQRWIGAGVEGGAAQVDLFGQPSTFFEVTAFTSDIDEAGTDGVVELSLVGASGESDPLQLSHSDTREEPFERGQSDKFSVYGADVGEITAIRLAHKQTGRDDRVHLGPVEVVQCITGDRYFFECNKWVTNGDAVELAVKSHATRAMTVPYEVIFETANASHSSTDANVSLVVIGDDGQGQEVSNDFFFDKTDDKFEPGSSDSFDIGLSGIATPTRVRVSHDGSQSGSGWLLEKVTLRNVSTQDEHVFPIRQWLSKDEGDAMCEVAAGTLIEYTFEVVTSDIQYAGTDANVYAYLEGDTGATWRMPLESDAKKLFERNKTDTFTVTGQDVGNINLLRLGHDGRRAAAGWHVHSVKVTSATGKTAVFPVHMWFDSDTGDRLIERVLHPRDVNSEVPYDITFGTADEKGAGFNSAESLSMSVIGTDAEGQESVDIVRFWDADKHSFATGKSSTFERGLLDMHAVTKLRLICPKADKWILDRIEFKNKSTGTSTLFLCRRTVFEDDDHREIELLPTLGVSDYELLVETGSVKHAGTDAHIDVILHAADGSTSAPMRLKKSLTNKKPFKQGKTDKFVFENDTLNDITAITVESDAHGFGAGWYLKQMTLSVKGRDESLLFPYNAWIPTEHDDCKQVIIPVRHTELEVPYEIAVRTASDSTSHFDGQVVLNIEGEDEAGERVFDVVRLHEATKKDMLPSTSSHFERGLVRVAVPTQVSLTHTGREGVGFKVEKVDLVNRASGQAWSFDMDIEVEREAPSATPRAFGSMQAVEYVVTFSTSDVKNGGTESKVYVAFIGEDGDTEARTLDRTSLTNDTAFLRKGVDRFVVIDRSVGKLSHVRVGLEESTGTWHLAAVEVAMQATGECYTFPYHDWIPTENDKSLERTLEARDVTAEIPYEIRVYTAENKTGGTDQEVSFVVTGESADGETVTDRVRLFDAKRDAFSPGHKSVFLRGLLSMASPQTIVIGHDGNGRASEWDLEKVELKNQTTGSLFTFLCPDVINKGAVAELTAQAVNEYQIDVTTSDEPSASLSLPVKLTLIGTKAATPVFLRPSSFKQGETESFTEETDPVEPIRRLRVDIDSQKHGKWHLAEISVQARSSEQAYTFPCHDWLSVDKDDSGTPARMLTMRNTAAEVPYEIHILTARDAEAGTDASVCLIVSGEDADGHTVSDTLKFHEANENSFERSSQAVFNRGILNMATPRTVVIGHDASGSHNQWKVDKVILVNKQSGLASVFPFGDWLSATEPITVQSEPQLHVARFAKADPLGFIISEDVGDLRVTKVFDNSSAQAQLKLNDQLLEVDGEDVSTKTAEEATALAAECDGTVDLLVARELYLAEWAEIQGEQADTYEVTVITSDETFAGTDANVFLQLFGSEGESAPTLLSNTSGDSFEAGARMTVPVFARSVGEVQRVKVSHDGSGMFSAWNLSRVEVVCKSSGDLVIFECDEPLTDSEPERELSAATTIPRDAGVLYEVEFVTSDIDFAGTDANVALTLTGVDVSGREATVDVPLDTVGMDDPYAGGKSTSFNVTVPGIVEPTRIRVCHDGSKAMSDWHLEKVVLTNQQQATTFTFPCRAWLNGDNGHAAELVCKELTTYEVDIHTSDVSGAGTDAMVTVVLIGENGDETWVNRCNTAALRHEEHEGRDRFERNQHDLFRFEAQDVTPVSQIRIAHDGQGLGSAWHLDKVVVTAQSTNETRTFQLQEWIPSNENKATERLLNVRHVEREVPYEIRFFTCDEKNAGTSATVSLSVIGLREDETPCSDVVRLYDAESSAFSQGQTATFERGLVDMHVPTKLVVKLSKADAWKLDRVEFVNKNTNEEYDFLCRKWIAESKDSLDMCLAGGDLVEYEVNVITGDIKGANITGKVLLTLIGATAEEESVPIVLKDSTNNKKPFHRGQTDEFKFEAEPFNELSAIKVAHHGSSAWFLSSVEISRAGSDEPVAVFVCNRWLPKDAEEPTLVLRRDVEREVPYKIVIQTSEEPDSSTDCEVYLKVFGEDEQGQPAEDVVYLYDAKKDSFDVGAESKFERGLLAMANPTRIEVGHDGNGKKTNWKLETVSLLNAQTAEHNIFVCRDVVGAGAEGAKTIELTDVAEYLLSVTTTTLKNSYTDGAVTYTFTGSRGELTVTPVHSRTHPKKYQTGNVDKFTFVDAPIGEVQSVKVSHTGSSWHLGEIELAEAHSADVSVFVYNDWVYDASRLEPVIERRLVQREVPYVITFYTADQKKAGCDCLVTLEVEGVNADGEHVTDSVKMCDAQKHSFQPASESKFKRGFVDMVEPQVVRISHDSSGKQKAWHLLKVSLLNETTQSVFTFSGGGVIGEGPDAQDVQVFPLSDLVEYVVNVKTDEERFSGTGAEVRMKLVGTNGETGDVQLKRSRNNKTPFVAGKTDEFVFDEAEVGEINELEIWHDASGRAPDWKLNSVDVTAWWEGPSQQRRYVFPCNSWLKDEDTHKTLTWDSTVPFTLRLETLDEEGAGTVANVFLTVFGRSWDGADRSDVVKLSGNKKPFKPGETSEFDVQVSDIAWPCLVELGHNGKGDDARWGVGKVTLVNELTNETFEFPCHEFIDSAHERVTLPLLGTQPEVTVEVENDTLVTSNDVLFYPWKAALRPGSEKVLEAVAQYLLGSDYHVEVVGSCNGGRRSAGLQQLSEDRAKAAANELQALGVDAGRISTRGAGCGGIKADNARVAFLLQDSDV